MYSTLAFEYAQTEERMAKRWIDIGFQKEGLYPALDGDFVAMWFHNGRKEMNM